MTTIVEFVDENDLSGEQLKRALNTYAALSTSHSPPPSANGPNPHLEQFVVDGTFKFPQIRGIPFACLHDLDLRNRTVNLKTTV